MNGTLTKLAGHACWYSSIYQGSWLKIYFEQQDQCLIFPLLSLCMLRQRKFHLQHTSCAKGYLFLWVQKWLHSFHIHPSTSDLHSRNHIHASTGKNWLELLRCIVGKRSANNAFYNQQIMPSTMEMHMDKEGVTALFFTIMCKWATPQVQPIVLKYQKIDGQKTIMTWMELLIDNMRSKSPCTISKSVLIMKSLLNV